MPDFRIDEPGVIRLVRVRVQRPNWALEIDTSTAAPWFVDLDSTGNCDPMLAVDGSPEPCRDGQYGVWKPHHGGGSVVQLAYPAGNGKTW
ncbi:MAG TPA: hypothetical protein VF737_13815 [Gemmatimonadaceae bacterium]